MVEAQEGFAALEDVDEATFIRFIEWAHKGYYTAAEFVQEREDEVVTTAQETRSVSQGGDEVAPVPETPQYFAQAVAESFEVDSWSQPYKKGKKSKREDEWGVPPQGRKMELKEAFISRKYTVRQTHLIVPSPRPNQNLKEDYTQVFLSHVRLYVFADKYDIQRLKVLALEELHATLAVYNLYHKRTGDIIALLRYVSGNICEREQSNEGMRKLMKQYVGCEMDTLVGDEEFKDLLIEDGGPLLGDFMMMVRRMIKER